jgi:hypothetical protein
MPHMRHLSHGAKRHRFLRSPTIVRKVSFTMKQSSRHLIALLFFAIAPTFGSACSVALTQDPLVQPIGIDEFRVAFGLDGAQCAANGCHGDVTYRVQWQGDRGHRGAEQRTVAFSIPAGTQRSLTVDRQYFHAAETSEIIDVTETRVSAISCERGENDE